jgi:hypothetical protein
MSTAIGFLALLLPLAAVAWIVRAFRQKTAAKEARSQERIASLMALGRGAGAAVAAATAGGTAPGSAPRPNTTPAADSPPRFLTQREALTFYLLKAGLPGHEIFPRVDLAAVLAGSGAAAAPSPGVQPQPGRYKLDFVVCDKSMRVLAAVRLRGEPGLPGGEWADSRIAAAGIRLVTLDPAALPRREQIPGTILGRTA